ncbi:MAG: hypothetical protein U0271_24500 [Polyangiaceae bacterium]
MRSSRRDVLAAVAAVASSAALAGCGGSLTPAASYTPDPEVFDSDPFVLVPRHAVALLAMDLKAAFTSPFATEIGSWISSALPFGAEATFVPSRDTTRALGALLALQGTNFCAIVQGRFDGRAIGAAAEARRAQGGANPMVLTPYAGHSIYTVQNVGFALLSQKTIVIGDEIAIRRVLDRVAYTASLERVVPDWMTALAATRSASFALAANFGVDGAIPALAPEPGAPAVRAPTLTRASANTATQAILEAGGRTYGFLRALRAMRVLGNFQAPGLNIAGSLTYTSKEHAEAGAGEIRSLSQMLSWVTTFGGGSFTPPSVAVSGADVGVVEQLDAGTAQSLLSMVGGVLRR